MANEDFDIDAEIADDVEVEEVDTVAESVEEEPKAPVATKSSDVARPMPGLNLDFSFLGNIQGAEAITIGTPVSRFAVDRFKFNKEQKILLSILSDTGVMIKSHYFDKVGSVFCNGGICCKRDEKGYPTTKIVFPCFVYGVCSKSGKLTEKIMGNYVVGVGRNIYESLSTIGEMNNGLSNLNLIVTCEDSNYQKLSFFVAGQAAWKGNEKVAKSIQEFWNKNADKMLESFGRSMTDEELTKRLNEANGDVANFDASKTQMSAEDAMDFDDMFK